MSDETSRPAGGRTATADLYEISLEMFEGPLDLLLHLVKKHELSILDIPIAFVTERYLAYLDRMQHLNVEVASEYLLMAATLAWLKSLELVPSEKVEGEGDEEASEGDPRQELIRRLLEYQKYKEAGHALDQRPVLGRNVYLRGAPEKANDLGPAPLKEVELYRLVEEFARVLARVPKSITHNVVVERVRLMDKIQQLAGRLEREPMFLFDECFAEATTRHELVVTFLALLEMARLKVIQLQQSPESSAIMVSRASADLSRALAGLDTGEEGLGSGEESYA